MNPWPYFNFVSIPLTVDGVSVHVQATQVTQAVWKRVMGNNPSHFKGDELPVETVSWNDVQDFIIKLNRMKKDGYIYRLPTEPEWEFACRAGTVTEYSFGDDVNQLSEYAWFAENSGGMTHPVATKEPNPYGLHDMHGNVWEWTQDLYKASFRVVRGGSWYNNPEFLRSSYRNYTGPGGRLSGVGFRLVRTCA
jgi:formylglycine-generating enzyme required for sulfatase activity